MLCPICFEETNDVFETKCCKNKQHKSCLKEWVVTGNAKCPLCRGDMDFKYTVYLSKVPGRSGPLFQVAEAEYLRRYPHVALVNYNNVKIYVTHHNIHETREQAELKAAENRRRFYAVYASLHHASHLTRMFVSSNANI